MGDVERPQQLGVDHLGLSVTNLARSEAFYCDVLGANVIFARHEAAWGQRSVLMLGPHAVDLNQFARNDGTSFDPSRAGLDHLAFTADSREALDAWAGWLDTKGVPRSAVRDVRIDPGQDPDVEIVGAMFDFADPDGVQLEFLFFDHTKLGPNP